MRRKYGIDQVSVRLVKETPILSEEESGYWEIPLKTTTGKW